MKPFKCGAIELITWKTGMLTVLPEHGTLLDISI